MSLDLLECPERRSQSATADVGKESAGGEENFEAVRSRNPTDDVLRSSFFYSFQQRVKLRNVLKIRFHRKRMMEFQIKSKDEIENDNTRTKYFRINNY